MVVRSINPESFLIVKFLEPLSPRYNKLGGIIAKAKIFKPSIFSLCFKVFRDTVA